MAVEVDSRDAKRALSRLRAKIEEEAGEINFLNIMPMMDMMTILLVFLIKQFSVQQLALNTASGLVLVDKRTPYRLLTEVLYSAGQAEFNNYRLVVLQKGQ